MRQFILLVVKVAITLSLLYFAVGRINLDVIAERWKTLDLAWSATWLAVAIAIMGLQLVFLSARWQRIARQCGASLGGRQAFRFSLIATFFNQVLPSTVGGDAVRIWLLARDGAGWAKATHSVLLDRFIGVLALAVLVVGCLPWSLRLIEDPVGRIALLIIGFGSIGGAIVFIALGYLRWDWLQRFAPTRHLTQMAVTAREILFSAEPLAVVMGLSLTIHVLTAAAAWSVARAVGAPFEFAQALQLIPPVILIATVPISIAGWGVREKSLVLAFGYAGLFETDGFLISVLLGAVMFLIGIIGGIAWLLGREPVKLAAALQAAEPPVK